MVYDGERFMVDNLAINTVLKKLENMLESKLDKTKHHDLFKKLNEHYKLKKNDGEYVNATNKELNDVLYNYRDIPKETKKINALH